MAMLRLSVNMLRWPMFQKISFFVVSSSLPLFCLILWLVRNTQLPTADAANYLSTAINIYHHFIHGGINEGLHSLYFDRGWRPIFFPSLLVPFLGLFHGNLYMASNSMILTTFFISLLYVYLIMRLRLDTLCAIIATNLIGLLPLFQTQFLTLFAESAFFPCVMASLYHLIKSNYMQDVKQSLSFACFVSLAILIRPVEAVMHLFLVMMIFMYLGWHHGVFSLQSIGKMKNLFMPVFSLIILLVFLWFLPFADETRDWIYRTSIGDVAIGAGPARYSFWQTAYNYLSAEGSVVVIGITLIALISLFSLERIKLYGVLSSVIFIYLISMIPFAFVEVFYSVQATPRRLSVAFPALLMSLLLLGLQRGRFWSVRFGGILVLLIIQFIFVIILNLTSKYEMPMPWLNMMIGYLIPQPITVNPNPHNKILQFFSSEVKKYHLTDIILEVNGEKLTILKSLASTIAQYDPKQPITLKVLRNGTEISLTVNLGERTAE